MAIDKHEQIRHRAYEIWEEEGRPTGADLRHWLQACDELDGGEEHETLQDVLDLDEDDRDDAALLQGTGESGDFDPRRTGRVTDTLSEEMETTADGPPHQKLRKTEGQP